MTLFTSFSAVTAGLLVGFSAVVGYYQVQELDAATTRQCANADWPRTTASDDRHRDFCKAYGYTTPTRGTYAIQASL